MPEELKEWIESTNMTEFIEYVMYKILKMCEISSWWKELRPSGQ